jgi:Dyp-type peroxidase family
MATPDLANIQGNVLRGYRFAVASYICLRVDDASRARAWLQEFAAHVTNSTPWENKPPSTVNIAFTFSGLKALEVPETTLTSFSTEFQQGMANRADILGDTDESSPSHWEGGLGTPAIHVLVNFNALHAAALQERSRWFEEMLTRCGGLTIVYQQDAALLPTLTEQFGYTDGIGQPSVNDSNNPPLPGQGVPEPDGTWRPLKAGEFVLGYPDEEGLMPDAPVPGDLARNGTYLVFRKLHQNVALFRKYLRQQAAHYPGGEELLAAKLVGRWRDGTPLELSPSRPDTTLAGDPNRNNDFHYSSDPAGKRCPMGAHIRRTNPRDDGIGKTVLRHRIMRRGVTYGPMLPAGVTEDDGQDRGVIFMALNADINRQFEFIQSQWINDGNIFGLGTDKDMLVGNHDGKDKMTINGQPPYFLGSLPRFVTVKGGDYFFMPGINGLEWLATAPASRSAAAPAPVLAAQGASAPHEKFLKELEAIPEQVAGEVEPPFVKALKVLEAHLLQDPEPLFALLREVKPILVTHGIAVVTRFEDVQEVLSYPSVFNVIYAPKMEAITGDFILGLDNNPQYEHDVSVLRLAFRRGDLPQLAQIVARHANEVIAAAGAGGTLDFVGDYTEVVPARVIADYIGVQGPDEETLSEWANLLFDEIFNNVKNDPALTRPALAAAQEWRSQLDNLIAQRKARMAAGDPGGDDVLGRLLQMQKVPGASFDDAGIRNNLIGLITGWIPTVSKSVSMAMNVLLDRPHELAAAQEAARNQDDNMMTATMFEAMRFAPQNPGLLRKCSADYVLAAGTERASRIPAGTIAFAATQSAMMDKRVIPDPGAFRLDRPSYHYMHFGWGLHTCFGQYIDGIQIPLMAKAVLSQRNLRRAPGDAGKLAFDGNFPGSMTLLFDPS